jgi:hypothetical protein
MGFGDQYCTQNVTTEFLYSEINLMQTCGPAIGVGRSQAFVKRTKKYKSKGTKNSNIKTENLKCSEFDFMS